MTTFEALFIVIISILTLPYLCRVIKHSSLLYCMYLLVGLLIGDALELHCHYMIEEAGKIGFLLLLFEVGLEIQLPPFRIIKKSLPFCLSWILIQAPLISLVSHLLGFGLKNGFIAAAGINACSLGIIYGLLDKESGNLEKESRDHILIGMILLEVIALFFLAGADIVCKYGWGRVVISHSVVLIGFLLLVRLFSGSIHKHISKLLESTGNWKIHRLLLVIFSVAIIGDRLGLSAPKTIFFLGLFMKAVTEHGIKFEDELRPIAQGIFIPIFFISLGSKISITSLFPTLIPLAALIVLFLLGVRYYIFRKFSGLHLPSRYFLLYCPNLTMVAVATEILSRNEAPKPLIDFILAVGLLMTLWSCWKFPIRENETQVSTV